MGLFGRSRRHQQETAVGAAILGVLLSIAAFPMLFLNEGRAVKTARSLKEGAASVVSVENNEVVAANEGKFIHISGEATTEETLTDTQFGVSAQALRLMRSTEMYQWQEVAEEVTRTSGGKTTKETEYKYEKVWTAEHLDSSGFHEKEGHENPSNLPFKKSTTEAQKITVGAFILSSPLAAKIDNSEPLLVDLSDVPQPLADNLRPDNGTETAAQGFYWMAHPGSETTEVGDVRIRYSIVPKTVVSVMAQQSGQGLRAYKTHHGRELNMLSIGNVSADEMIDAAETANTALSWALRIAGTAFLVIGIGLLLKPLTTMTSWIPLVGNIVGMGTALVSTILGVALSLLTISTAWLFYRPLIAIPLIVCGIGLIWFLLAKSKRDSNGSVGPA